MIFFNLYQKVAPAYEASTINYDALLGRENFLRVELFSHDNDWSSIIVR